MTKDRLALLVKLEARDKQIKKLQANKRDNIDRKAWENKMSQLKSDKVSLPKESRSLREPSAHRKQPSAHRKYRIQKENHQNSYGINTDFLNYLNVLTPQPLDQLTIHTTLTMTTSITLTRKQQSTKFPSFAKNCLARQFSISAKNPINTVYLEKE